MFTKIYYKIDLVFKRLADVVEINNNRYKSISDDVQLIQIALNHMPEIKSMQKTIESQQRTIEQLTNALKDKYEHGLFIFSEDYKIPMVIRNGKELTNEMTSYFGIDWNIGEIPVLNIEQRAGTYHDVEV